MKITKMPPSYPAGFDFSGGAYRADGPMVINIATYEGRGWCYEENCISNLAKGSYLVLDLGKFSGTKTDFGGVEQECMAGREPPHSPESFNAIVESKSFTNKEADLPIVKSLYKTAFDLRIGQAEGLNFHSLNWRDAEAAVLSKALHAAKVLVNLTLGGNRIGDEGAAALAAALREGAAPKLQNISVNGTKVSEEAKQALRDAREGLEVA